MGQCAGKKQPGATPRSPACLGPLYNRASGEADGGQTEVDHNVNKGVLWSNQWGSQQNTKYCRRSTLIAGYVLGFTFIEIRFSVLRRTDYDCGRPTTFEKGPYLLHDLQPPSIRGRVAAKSVAVICPVCRARDTDATFGAGRRQMPLKTGFPGPVPFCHTRIRLSGPQLCRKAQFGIVGASWLTALSQIQYSISCI